MSRTDRVLASMRMTEEEKQANIERNSKPLNMKVLGEMQKELSKIREEKRIEHAHDDSYVWYDD